MRLPNLDPVEIDPKNFPDYEVINSFFFVNSRFYIRFIKSAILNMFKIFVECLSNNKILKKGATFLYQVFPNNITFYHDQLMKSCREKDIDGVQRLVDFFSKFNANFINLKEQSTSLSALHVVAQNGYFVC